MKNYMGQKKAGAYFHALFLKTVATSQTPLNDCQ